MNISYTVKLSFVYIAVVSKVYSRKTYTSILLSKYLYSTNLEYFQNIS